jgi:hypothetical protein
MDHHIASLTDRKDQPMINRVLYSGVLGAALVTFSAGAYAQTIGDVFHQTVRGDLLDDVLGDVGGFLVGLLGFLV